MTTRTFIGREIGERFKGYSRFHPIVDIVNESLVGTRFYELSQNKTLLGENITKNSGNSRNAFAATFYDEPDRSTLITIYNVEEPRLHENAHALTFTRHWWEHLTIQNIQGQPKQTNARPYFLQADLAKYQLELESETDGVKIYRNDNLRIRVSGPGTKHFEQIETAFRLVRYSNAVMFSIM